MAKLPKEFTDKLASSGLSEKDAAELGIEYVPNALKVHKGYKPIHAAKINYYDIDGKLQSAQPGWKPFYRLRYLTVSGAASFSDLTDKKQVRYVQEPDSGIGVYFPKNVDWREIAQDIDTPIIITEGEFKAAKACKEGFPTFGLGGVWNFRSAKAGIPFIPILEQFVWAKRNVYIVYDSDFREKEGIVLAINALAEELYDRGALPMVATLPDLLEDDGKTGLDDFLIHPAGGSEQLAALLHEAQPLTLAKPLWALNDQVCYIRDPGLIIEQKTDNKMSPSAFKEHAYAAAKYMEQEFKSDGTVSLNKVPAAAAWLKWQHRKEAIRLTYSPGKDKFCDGQDGIEYNTWPGWGCKPIKGTTAPWKKLVQYLFSDTEKEAVEWFLDWCAYPLQYPGTKLFSAVVVHGVYEGTGKSLIGYTLGAIYGENFIEIRQQDLHGGRNDWAENKQFILGDEVTGSDKRQDADTLKKLITQKEMRVDIKYVPAYSLPDRINYYFTSNQPDAFFMSDKDRRYMIVEVTQPPLDEDFYAEYDLWLHGRGPSHLFHELLTRDLSNFNPSGPAPVTRAKLRMVEDTRSDLGSWVKMLVSDPDRFLRVGSYKIERDLVTNKDLLALYDIDGTKRVTANGMGRELRRAGVPLVNGGGPVSTSLGFDRFYAIRNADKWLRATTKQIRDHVDKAEGKLVKKGVKR